MFFYTIDGKQSSVVCCHNDTLDCSISGFLTISGVSVIVNVMCFAVPAAPSLLIFGSMAAIIIARWGQRNQIAKCEFTVLLCILEGTDTRASGIGVYSPHLLKYQDFLSMNSILKESVCF